MSGLLKELHCPSEELVSGILKGRLMGAQDHLTLLRASSPPAFPARSQPLDKRPTLLFLSGAVFLSSELQAAQIAQCRRGANTHDCSPGRRELLAMCSALDLPEAAGLDAAGVLTQVREAVRRERLRCTDI